MDDEPGMSDSLRLCLKVIRDVSTLPSTVLPNGQTASETAHQYVLRNKCKRRTYKMEKYRR